MIKLTSKDWQILSLLDQNCRLSDAQIAKKVRLSKQAVNYRIKRLENQKVIAGYATNINYAALGLQTYEVRLKLRHQLPKDQDKIIHELSRNASIRWIAIALGNSDIVFNMNAYSIEHAYQELNQILSKYSAILETRTVWYMPEMYRFSRKYLYTSSKSTREVKCVRESPRVNFDMTDYKVLQEVCNNSRQSAINISKKIKIPAATVRRRIRKLLDEEVLHFCRSFIDKSKIGFQIWNILIQTTPLSSSTHHKFIEYCKTSPHITYLNAYNGFDSYGIELETKTIEEVYALILNLRREFSDVIKSYELIYFVKDLRTGIIPDYFLQS